jgi:pimeloyl-[acyl-carrier protein] synthase
MLPVSSSDMFNFFLPEFRQNPYPFYQRLRESDPVHWGISFEPGIDGMWHIARYSDILQILRDQRFTHQAQAGNSASATSPDFIDPLQLYFSLSRQSLLFADPPAHTRLRALVSRAFTPRMIEGLRPRVEATASALLQAGQKRGRLDVVNEYALPLTITIIAEMLGVPPEGRAQLTSWAGILIRAVDCKQSPDIYASAAQVAMEIYAYFTELLARRRQALGPDLLSQLLVAHDQEDRLSEAELIVTATTLLIAGHETTVNLISNGTYALLRHPEQLTLLRQRPDLMPSAIEEFLRFEASSQMASRYATEDMQVGGTTIQRGQIVNLLLGSGNRDPQAFSDPDHLNITRRENRHLAFGMGIHYCLGAPLARLEAQTAIGLLLHHFPGLRLLDARPQWRDTIGFRGLQRLDVTWDG